MRGLVILLASGCAFTPPAAPIDGAVTDAPPDPIDGDVSVAACAPLPVAQPVISVDNAASLRDALLVANAGTIELANGTYLLTTPLVMDRANVALRSASGDPGAVILDGGNLATPVVSIRASNITLTALTITRASGSAVIVEPTAAGSITGTTIHDVTLVDNVGPAIRMRPLGTNVNGPFADDGTIACSRVTYTPAGNPCLAAGNLLGISGEAVRGWTVRDNRFEGLGCTTKFVRSVRFHQGSRDISIANNVFDGSAGSIMMGFVAGLARSYPDALPAGCMGTPELRDGLVCNNVIAGLSARPLTGTPDVQEGIALWNACEVSAVHNTVVSPAGETDTVLEYRFAGTVAHLINNLLQESPTPREGPPFADHLPSNAVYASEADFVDARTDLHLAPGAIVPAGESIAALGVCSIDADGKPRNLGSPTVGAYER